MPFTVTVQAVILCLTKASPVFVSISDFINLKNKIYRSHNHNILFFASFYSIKYFNEIPESLSLCKQSFNLLHIFNQNTGFAQIL